LAELFIETRILACFDAVLAEFKYMRINIRAWPGTALTTKPILLIDLKPVAKAARETALAKYEFQTFRDRPHPRRHTTRLPQVGRANFFRRLRTQD
jgi:hypothetical protein